MKGAPRILVVDDDARLADNLVEYLTRLGYSARAAYNGKEGLAAFQRDDFTVVITDLMMPEMDGMAMLQAVCKLDPDALVIVLTGYGTIESAVTAIKSGACDYITKPLKLEEIEVTVQRALERDRIFRRMRTFRTLFFWTAGVMVAALAAVLFTAAR